VRQVVVKFYISHVNCSALHSGISFVGLFEIENTCFAKEIVSIVIPQFRNKGSVELPVKVVKLLYI